MTGGKAGDAKPPHVIGFGAADLRRDAATAVTVEGQYVHADARERFSRVVNHRAGKHGSSGQADVDMVDGATASDLDDDPLVTGVPLTKLPSDEPGAGSKNIVGAGRNAKEFVLPTSIRVCPRQ
ncbi:MAG: hypothetical protein WCP29_13395 [Acidobacteriota bacterium]